MGEIFLQAAEEDHLHCPPLTSSISSSPAVADTTVYILAISHRTDPRFDLRPPIYVALILVSAAFIH